MRFRVGDTYVTERWGKGTIADVHPAIVQIEPKDRGQFWVLLGDLIEEISGKKKANEEPRCKLPSARHSRRRSRLHKETDSVDNPQAGDHE
jgi:hypothetical protein